MTTLDRKPWPLCGYAPGNYSCRCHTCDKQFVGDKRATTCLECAVIEAKDTLSSIPEQGAWVKALEIVKDIAYTTAWRHHEEGRKVLADQIDAALAVLSAPPPPPVVPTPETHDWIEYAGPVPKAVDAVSLADCPVGLFMCGDELCLKTEYGNNEGRIDAYIVSTGEFFWGRSPQTIASQRATLVTPVDAIKATLGDWTP
jgi:hypothetical protein